MDSSAALGPAVWRRLLGTAVRPTPYNGCVLPFLGRASVVTRLGPCCDDPEPRHTASVALVGYAQLCGPRPRRAAGVVGGSTPP